MQLLKIQLTLIFLLGIHLSYAQNRDKAQNYIKELCSDEMAGRGYINNGVNVAADYLEDKFSSLGLDPVNGKYKHPFELDVNTISSIQLSLNQRTLKAGYDYMASPECSDVEINGNIFRVSETLLLSGKAPKKVKKAVKKGLIPVFDIYDKKNEKNVEAIKEIKECSKARVLFYLSENLVYSVGRKQASIPEVYIKSSAFNQATAIKLHVNAEYLTDFKSYNICGLIPGTVSPDSFIILCGHYDHLGKMGTATYHGANDNASGIAMILDMAEYFVNNPQRYSIVFIGFAGEEAGLVGSYNFVKSPPENMPLNRIKFVFNMDLMGNGKDGATLVNGSVFPDYFDQFVKINKEKSYLPKIKSRGKAANSDHYFFSESGIPSFFIYTMGDYLHYHIPEDNADNLVLGEYYDANFKLIRDFILALNSLN